MPIVRKRDSKSMNSNSTKKLGVGTKKREENLVVRVNRRGGLSVVDTHAYLNSRRVKKLIGEAAKIQTARN